ncbi:MAG: SusC/RagA family TonB-linked outer membrane protein [Bacteroidales bacterium]
MNKTKNVIVICLLLLSSLGVCAQKTSVLTGRVYEKVDGERVTIPGAYVTVADENNRYLTASITDVDGNYILRVPADKSGLKIIASFIGLTSQTVGYTRQTRLDFELETNAQSIQTVVVEGQQTDRITGLTERQKTTATQRVDMEALVANSPVGTIEDALQGQLGGVDIISGGGDPGARSSIRIRGTSTLSGSADPLIVIDGIPYNTDVSDDFDFASADAEDFGQLVNIAPTDIESIEVLKDAAATAIWGTQGGNGVLMITTKKGTSGKTRFNFSSKWSTRFEPKPMPLLNGSQYVSLMQDAIWNTAKAQGVNNSIDYLELLYATPEINYIPSWQYFDEYNQDVDWLDYLVRQSLTSDNNFAMTGGGERAKYRFSMGYLNDQGTTIGNDLKRLTSSLNVDYNFSDKLRVTAEFALSKTEKGSNAASVRGEAVGKMPNKSPYWINDETGEMTDVYFSRQSSDEFQGAFSGSKSSNYANFNPVAMAKEGYDNTSIMETRTNFRLRYLFNRYLSYEAYVSLRLSGTESKTFLPKVATGVLAASPYSNRSENSMSDAMSIQTENKLLFRKNWNDMHNVVATAIFRTSQSQGSKYYGMVSGTASAGLNDPAEGGVVVEKGSGISESRSMSSLFNVHYTLKDRYMINFTGNMEGRSNMGKNERFGFFPAVGLAWQVQEEEFMSNATWIDQLKIRAGYGTSGKAPRGTAPYLGSYTAVGDYMDMSGIAPTTIQLNNLKWESSREINIGTDIFMLKNRLNITFDWYNKKTDDLLQKDVSIPSSTGSTEIAFFNSGAIRNSGVEARVDYKIYQTKEWQVSVNANMSRNVNQIIDLPSNRNQESYTFKNGEYAQRLETGVPVGSFYGYQYEGVYQNLESTYARDVQGNVMRDVDGLPIVMQNGNIRTFAGDAKYKDINHDGVIDEYDIVYVGNSMPNLIFGGGFGVTYKALTLRAFFQGRLGQKVINKSQMNAEAMYGRSNQSTATLSRWRNEGDQTDMPRALYNYGYNYLGSDRFVNDASFVRLKTLTMSYQMPKHFVKKLGLNSLSFFITGYDLFTWTKYKGQDPEVKMPSSTNALVYDESGTPVSKRFSMGLNLQF